MQANGAMHSRDSPDLSKEERRVKKSWLPTHHAHGAREKPAPSRIRWRGLGVLLLLVFLLFILHRFGPTATQHLQPAALQDMFERAARRPVRRRCGG